MEVGWLQSPSGIPMMILHLSDDKGRDGRHSQFMEQYREGFELTSKSTSDKSTAPAG